MVTAPINSEYRTRLIDLLGPDAALAEAIATFLCSRLAKGEKAETALFAEPSLRDCLALAEDRLYTFHQMTDVFSAYRKHLSICDLDPNTKEMYWQIVIGYRKWLNNKLFDAPLTPKNFWLTCALKVTALSQCCYIITH